MKVKTGYAPTHAIQGFHPDKRHCDCGGSGWIPGIPDDEPCPHHAERDSSLSSPPLRSGSLKRSWDTAGHIVTNTRAVPGDRAMIARALYDEHAAGRLAGLREALEEWVDPDGYGRRKGDTIALGLEARIAELERQDS